ncbi:unnamed protein product [Caenorhabditis bovis]|uniref:KRIT N-terminal NPxY motif-rich region domain-containing protein n=1 Tax=Caenorhabditis bovis TaxID=2654633 RepID=A0A8S1F4J2_9PELO|nr:unnamed protein product [Caenorhabditis bovis]
MAEVFVAIVRLKISALSDRKIPTGLDYEICVKGEPATVKSFGNHKDYSITKRVTVGGHTIGENVFKLPLLSFEPSRVSTVEDMVHDFFSRTGNSIRRVVRVKLNDDNFGQPSSSSSIRHIPGLSLACVPVFVKENVEVAYSHYENLQKLVNLCHTQPEMFEVHTKHMILILERWLISSQQNDEHFISGLFMREACRTRMKQCAHNPVYIDLLECFRNKSSSVRSNNSSADLDDTVHSANFARLVMLRYNKFDIVVINPAYDPNCEQINSRYYFVGMNKARVQRAISTSSQDYCARMFPLHKAAEDGNLEEVKRLLNLGADTNKRDDDCWTPLHYACFYGHLEIVVVLLNSPNMISINAQNNGGATALHYAVINGNEYLVELLTSHASIDINIRNNDGLRAIDYCTNHPNIRGIIEMQLYKTKINVDSIIGAFSIKSKHPEFATVAEILERLAVETHLQIEQMACFAIFIYSDSLSLQLRPDSLIQEMLKVDKWNSTIRKIIPNAVKNETPRLKLRRNAYATAGMELKLVE